ncbi:hypothetical protein BBJ28_00003401 [Nothophytophthora sp. Chile5]|nr:hypothetical protein BBJ28_00003401 [Nothophytophthora sp. Chile5]
MTPNPGRSAHQVSAAGGASLPPKPKKKRSHTTPTRDRERRELLALRVQAVELQLQLQTERERLAVSGRSRVAAIAANGGRQFSVAPAWRHIARRHLAARRAAESENFQLRERLASHLKWGTQLQEKMNRRTTASPRNSAHPAAAAALGTVANPLLLAQDEEGITDLELELDDADRAELEMLATGLDAAYATVDIVFKDRTVTEAAVDGARVVELRDTRVIPFEFRLAIDAVWNAWVLWHLGGSCRKSVSAHRSCSYPEVARPEHTFAVKFRLQCAVLKPTPTMFLDLKLVLRRYMEPNRMVLVWRGLSEGEEELAGLSTDETGWVVIERMLPFPQATHLDEETSALAGRTVMHSCVRMTPKRAEGCSTEQSHVLTELVVNSYKEDVSFIYREMEAQLLRVSRSV